MYIQCKLFIIIPPPSLLLIYAYIRTWPNMYELVMCNVQAAVDVCNKILKKNIEKYIC